MRTHQSKKRATAASSRHSQRPNVEDSGTFIMTISSNMVTLGLLKTQYCHAGIAPGIRAQMAHLEREMRGLLADAQADRVADYRKANAAFSKDFETLQSLILGHCRLRNNRQRKKSASGFDGQGRLYVTTRKGERVPVSDDQLLGTDMGPDIIVTPGPAYPQKEGFMSRLKRLLKIGNKQVVAAVVQPAIKTNWAIIQRINSSGLSSAKNPQVIVDNWGLLLHIVMLCVEQRQEWVLQTLPPKLQYVLKVSFMYLMHITKVLLGDEGEIDIVAVQKRSFFEKILNSASKSAAKGAVQEGEEAANRIVIESEKAANRMVDKMEVTVKKLIMTLFAAILVQHIIGIYLDKDRRDRLPAPIRFIMDTVDNPLSKLPTRRVPRILTILFGVGIVGLGIGFSNNPDAFMKTLKQLVRSDPVTKEAFQDLGNDLKRAADGLESATTSDTTVPKDEDEFYDASLFGESL